MTCQYWAGWKVIDMKQQQQRRTGVWEEVSAEWYAVSAHPQLQQHWGQLGYQVPPHLLVLRLHHWFAQLQGRLQGQLQGQDQLLL